MNTQIERILNQSQRETLQPTHLNPEFIAGMLGNLDMIDGVYRPVVTPQAAPVAVPVKKSDLAQRWLTLMILVVGMGVLSLQQQVKPTFSAPTLPRAAAPMDVKQSIAPVVSMKPTQAAASQRMLKMNDLQMKLGRILKRADAINAKARLASAQ